MEVSVEQPEPQSTPRVVRLEARHNGSPLLRKPWLMATTHTQRHTGARPEAPISPKRLHISSGPRAAAILIQRAGRSLDMVCTHLQDDVILKHKVHIVRARAGTGDRLPDPDVTQRTAQYTPATDMEHSIRPSLTAEAY